MAKFTVPGGNPAAPIVGFDAATAGEFLQGFVLTKDGTNTPLASHVTRGLVVDMAGNSVVDGRMNVNTAGVPTPVWVPSVPCKAVALSAYPGNQGTRIAIGSSACDASDAGYRGLLFLPPGESGTILVSNVNLLYIDALVNNDGVSWGVVA